MIQEVYQRLNRHSITIIPYSDRLEARNISVDNYIFCICIIRIGYKLTDSRARQPIDTIRHSSQNLLISF